MSDQRLRRAVRTRWTASIVLGLLAGPATGVWLGPAAGVLAMWGTIALVNTVWTLLQVWPMDAAATHIHATVEDPARTTARLVGVFGSVVSLGAVLVVAVQARGESGVTAYALAGVAVLSVVSSWLLIQMQFMLHYAHLYYDEPSGGISFHQDDDPEYTDFIYFALGLGMTYQVADTDISRNAIRRVVIQQTSLAYVFGAGIIATTINLVAGL